MSQCLVVERVDSVNGSIIHRELYVLYNMYTWFNETAVVYTPPFQDTNISICNYPNRTINCWVDYMRGQQLVMEKPDYAQAAQLGFDVFLIIIFCIIDFVFTISLICMSVDVARQLACCTRKPSDYERFKIVDL